MTRRPVIVHPILFAIYPFLFFFAQNIGKVPPGSLALPLAITLTSTALIWAVSTRILKDMKKPAILISIFLLMFFSYTHITKVLVEVFGSEFVLLDLRGDTGMIFLVTWSVLFFTLFVFLIKKDRNLDGLTRFLNFVSVILVTLPILNIGLYEARATIARHTPDRSQANAGPAPKVVRTLAGENIVTGQSPNIYYIVVDAYGNVGTLKKLYKYDNREFLDFLVKRGFYVAVSSHSNYNQTSLSLGSSLNLSYLDAFLDKSSAEVKDLHLMEYIIKNNKIFDLLRSRGYTIVSFASGRSETEIREADIYIESPGSFDESNSAVDNITPLPALSHALGEDPHYNAHRKTLLNILDRIGDTTDLPGPIFVFAHIELPHPPFVFGSDGETITTKGEFTDHDADWLIKRGSITREEYEKKYIDQVKFLNKKLISMIDDLLSRSKEKPIIILQSDHGPRSRMVWQDPGHTNLKECMSILNAYYFPDENYKDLYASISPVNSFRVILDRYLEGGYELLEDRSYFSTAEHPYDFIDVTDKIKQ